MRTIIAVLIAIALLAGLAIVLRHTADRAFRRPYSEAELRERWEADGTLQRLREFSLPLAGQAADALDPARAPQPDAPPHFTYFDLIVDAEGRILAVRFELGGADNHHGLLIGPGPPSRDWIWPVRAQWGDNVWWYDVAPGMEPR